MKLKRAVDAARWKNPMLSEITAEKDDPDFVLVDHDNILQPEAPDLPQTNALPVML